MTRHPIVLLEVATGTFRDAELLERIDDVQAKRAEDSWVTHIAAARASAASRGEQLPKLPHEHWLWAEKVKLTHRFLPYPTFGIECEGQMQGMMLLQTDGHYARLSSGGRAPLVYVDLLATAPWNLSEINGAVRFKGIGATLIRAAIELSLDLEFNGRIGLHALPTSEGWYDKVGLTCCGSDDQKQGMKYYELTPEQAREFLA